jgi:NAD(P)-dependent dehydrogenase (short-subunit alcohol dehydrogenase family)
MLWASNEVWLMPDEHMSNSRRWIMSKKLEGKIALVTGGSRGIGAAVAKRLAADGANVAITYAKDAKAASAVVKAIERAGQKAIAIQADSIDADAVAVAVEKTVATFGKLDVLVNNAGTAIPKAFEETTLEEMDRVLNINVRGVFAATQAALKHMNEGGRIIMIGSGWCPTRPRRGPSKCSLRPYPERSGNGASRLTTSNRVRSTRI